MSSTLPISMLGVWMSLVMMIGQHQVCGAECTSAFSAPRCSALSQLVYHRNSKIDHQVCPLNCWRTNRPKRIIVGPAPKMDLLAVDVKPLHDRMYMRMLSTLCCESFYGVQAPLDMLNPFALMQRGLVFQEIEHDLGMRMDRYIEAGTSPDRCCGVLLAAVDGEGNLVGFVDLSLALYNKEAQEFLVAKGPGLSIPGPDFERLPYISNLAVHPKFRRRGVGHKIMTEAHKWAAVIKGPASEIWLEVNESNRAAVELYTCMGYKVISVKKDAKEVVRKGVTYAFQSTTRLCLSMPLPPCANANELGEGQGWGPSERKGTNGFGDETQRKDPCEWKRTGRIKSDDIREEHS